VLTNALLDTGAQRTFIAEHLRTKLALTGHAEPYHSVGFGGVKATFDYSVSCVVRIFSLDRVSNALIKTSTLPDPIGDLYPEKFEADVHNHSSLRGLKMAPVLGAFKVDMIIGSDNAIALQSKQPDVLLPNGTMAKHSMFGYVLMGTRSLDVLRQGVARENEKLSTLNELDPLFVRSYRVSTETKPLTHLEKAGRIYDRSLMDLPERKRTLDNVDDELPMSLEDKFAFNNLTKSIRWTGQRFEASCLWKRNEPCLSNNRNAAIKRLDNALRNPKFKSVSAPVYNSTIADYLEKGYTSRTTALVTLFIDNCKKCVLDPPRRRPKPVKLIDCSMTWPNMRCVTYKKLSMLPMLLPDQVQAGENRIISAAQKFSDEETYLALSKGTFLRPNNSLHELYLFIDDDDASRPPGEHHGR
jgi:hypothetical protein